MNNEIEKINGPIGPKMNKMLTNYNSLMNH